MIDIEEELKRAGALKKGVDALVRTLKRWRASCEKGLDEIPELLKHLGSVEKSYREIERFDIEKSLAFAAGLRRWVEEREREGKYEFRAELSSALKEKGLALEGQVPELRTGFYRILADFGERRADIYFGPELEKGGIPLTVKDVSTSLISCIEKIEGRDFRAEDFLKMLLTAYRRALSLSGKGGGSPLPIVEVMGEVAFLRQGGRFRRNPTPRNFSEYSRSMFAYDLYRLNREGIKVAEGLRMTLTVATYASTKDRGDFLWVPESRGGGGTSFMYIAFKKDDTRMGLFDE